ncbi:alpha-2,8-polysialyltransferase family protein [Macrococcus armenti]|uniref:alpha-2,8-polysialyltransferase family protein n=1 Tax=Macrococcus armenti TaxID=2875764 RepID=UPI001CCD4843|nr:alpha-2,8-polysialyltransferase family protein [Macrococcus armenti]UBH09362.1 alpha-2,8-polysialyltransferase family protein [Macrococcus armenti]
MITVCSNQQQIINILNLNNNPKETNLLILDFNDQNYNVYLKLKDLNYFKSIEFLPIKKYMINNGNKISKIKSYIKNYFIIKKHMENYIDSLNLLEQVDVYACYPDLPTTQLIKTIKNKKKLRSVNLYDEGMYTYAFPNIKNRKNQVAKYLTGINFEKILKSVYVYEPSLINIKNVDIYPIQKLNDNNRIIELLIELFELQDMKFTNQILFLDQPFPNSKNYLDLIKRIKSLEEIVVKKHPRSILDNDIDQLNFNKAFELLLLSNNLNDKVLIAFTSSAMVTPKMMFNQEPIIVILYKLLDIDVGGNEVEKIISKLKHLYKNKEKIIVPETIEELESIIENFKEIGG